MSQDHDSSGSVVVVESDEATFLLVLLDCRHWQIEPPKNDEGTSLLVNDYVHCIHCRDYPHRRILVVTQATFEQLAPL